MLGADNFSDYPKKATEGLDPNPQIPSTFGNCTVVDGKACIASPTVPTSGLGLGTTAMSPGLGVDLSIPGKSGDDERKVPTSPEGASASPISPGGVDELDTK